MNVDPSGGQDVSRGIDFLAALAGNLAHADDSSGFDGDVTGESVVPCSIDDGCVSDDEIVHAGSPWEVAGESRRKAWGWRACRVEAKCRKN
jgi:hypothetical protein